MWRESQKLLFLAYVRCQVPICGRSQRACVFNQEIRLNNIYCDFDLFFDVDLLSSAFFSRIFLKADLLIKDSRICLRIKKDKRLHWKPGKLQL